MFRCGAAKDEIFRCCLKIGEGTVVACVKKSWFADHLGINSVFPQPLSLEQLGF